MVRSPRAMTVGALIDPARPIFGAEAHAPRDRAFTSWVGRPVSARLVRGLFRPTPVWYRSDTMAKMAMTLRLSDSEQEARRAVREFVTRGAHRDRVGHAAALVMDRHRDALRRLGE
jgi:hypothetical protein